MVDPPLPVARPEPTSLARHPFDPVLVRRSDPAGLAPAGGSRWPLNMVVNDRRGDPLGHVQSEVSMAVRGDTIVIGWNDAKGYGGAASLSGYGTSTDGGRTWRDGGEVPNGPLTTIAGDPSVVVLPDGTWVFGSVDLGNDDGVAIHRGRFTDGILDWEAPLLYMRSGGEALDKPYLATDPTSGALYLAYVNWSQNRGEVSRSDDGGLTWNEPLVVFESSRASGYIPTPGVDGGLYVSWTDRLGSSGTTHFVRHSADGGRSWSRAPHAIVTLDPEAHDPPLCFNREVNATFLDLAVDRGRGPYRGRVYAVWTDGRPGTFDVFLASSVDGAHAFGPPVRLNDNPNAATTESFWPVVDVAPDGGVIVGWYDRRHGDPSDEVSESLCDFYVTRSRDGAVSFGPNRRLSTMSVAWCGVPADLIPNFGDYVDLVATDSAVLATWSDARAGDPDVIFGRMDYRRSIDPEMMVDMTDDGLAAATRAGGNPFPAVAISARSSATGPVTLRVRVSHETRARILIYDASGRRVRELAPRSFTAGAHEVPFDRRDGGGRSLTSGVYFLELATEHLRARGKLVIR